MFENESEDNLNLRLKQAAENLQLRQRVAEKAVKDGIVPPDSDLLTLVGGMRLTRRICDGVDSASRVQESNEVRLSWNVYERGTDNIIAKLASVIDTLDPHQFPISPTIITGDQQGIWHAAFIVDEAMTPEEADLFGRKLLLYAEEGDELCSTSLLWGSPVLGGFARREECEEIITTKEVLRSL